VRAEQLQPEADEQHDLEDVNSSVMTRVTVHTGGYGFTLPLVWLAGATDLSSRMRSTRSM
jgi:hypothetical protein